MLRRIVIAAVVVAGLVGAVLGGAWLLQRRLMYFPHGRVPPVDEAFPGAADVTLHTSDGLELGGWFLPADGEPVAAAVIFNGNAGNRSDRADLAARLAARSIATLLFDYRGFGGNQGNPSETGLARDARAAADYLEAQVAVPVVYFGESLGTAVAVELATHRPPAVLVLRSPFTSMVALGEHHYGLLPVGLLLKDRYPTIDRIPSVDVPLLVIAGTADETIPAEMSTTVYEAAPGRKRLVTVDGAGHNDPALTGGDALADAIAGFVTEMLDG